MDSTLSSEFYLKGFDWLNKPEADKAYTENRDIVYGEWLNFKAKLKLNKDFKFDQNTLECMDAVF